MVEISEFINSVFAHWLALVTGGILVALVFVVEKLTNWKPPRSVYVGLLLVALLPASFLAWRDEHRKWQMTIVELANREGQNEHLRRESANRMRELDDLKAKYAAVPKLQGCPPFGVNPRSSESITVSSVPTGFTESRFHPPGARQAVAAHISIENGAIRYSDTGAAPLHLADQGATGWVCGASIPKYQAVREGSADAILRVSYYW